MDIYDLTDRLRHSTALRNPQQQTIHQWNKSTPQPPLHILHTKFALSKHASGDKGLNVRS